MKTAVVEDVVAVVVVVDHQEGEEDFWKRIKDW